MGDREAGVRGGLVFKAHRRLYHSTLGLRVERLDGDNDRVTRLPWGVGWPTILKLTSEFCVNFGAKNEPGLATTVIPNRLKQSVPSQPGMVAQPAAGWVK